ncbi:MAG: hypothetical protein V3U84_04245 [Thiotrichaceae bacterium]
MAFVKADLTNITGMPGGVADYVYVSDTDVQATVVASGYFNNDDDNQNFAADDLIHVRGDQGQYTIRVIAVTAGVVTTGTLVGGSYETLITTKSVEAEDSGKTFFLDLAGGFTVTLPVPALGLRFRFVVKTAPTTAYIIVTDSSANIIQGSICSPEVVALVAVVADADDINFVANLALPGDWCELESDGTSWFLRGMTFVQDGMTTTST